MSAPFFLLTILGAVLVTVFVRKRRIQPGLVIVVVASAVSFIPGLPRLEVEPEVILSIVMPPLLYSAALHFSTARFARAIRPIFVLGVGLVLVTAFAIAGLVSWLVPAMSFSAALVLAAVVSPPDTVTTVTKGAEIGLPRRLVDILTGESLINDATALVVFTLAVGAVTGRHAVIDNPVLYFGYAAVIGIVVGLVIGSIAAIVRWRADRPTLEVVVSILVPFTAYLSAEALEASGVLAVVFAGFVVAARASFDVPGRASPTAYATRLQEGPVWPVVDLLLEAFVFSYLGLQFRFVLDDLVESGERLWPAVGLALLVLLTVIVVRFAWVFLVFGRWALQARLFRKRVAAEPERWAAAQRRHEELEAKATAERVERQRRRLIARFGDDKRTREQLARINERLVARGKRPRRGPLELGWKENVLVSWTGMRGIVTLAAAGGIPATTLAGAPFPGRPLIQLSAFVVAIGTLLLQGLTLPWLAERLAIDTSADDDEEQAALDAARRLAGLREVPVDRLEAGEFDAARGRPAHALADRAVDEDAARTVIHEIDLEQAAFEARRRARPEPADGDAPA